MLPRCTRLRMDVVGTTKSLNVADLECPTFGLGPGTGKDGKPCRTIGPPYLPLIVPPPQVLSLDPGWLKACTGLLSYAVGLSSFAIYDPPIALQPASGLVASDSGLGKTDPVTTQDPPSDPVPTLPVQPAQVPSANLPSATVRGDEDPVRTGNPQNPPSAADPPKPKTPIQTIVGTGPPPPDIPEEGSQRTSQGLGGLIMGAFGPDPLINPVPPNIDRPYTSALAALLTVGDQTFAPSKGGFTVAGTPVLPGSAPITVAGTPVSLSPSGEVFIGGSKIDAAQQDPEIPPSETLTAGGQPFVPGVTGFLIAGSQVLPGSAPIYISGTPVSLGTSGNLIIGSSSVNLPIQNLPPPNTFKVGGETITADPTGFSIHGSRILPGSAPVYISGTPVSLGTTGDLVIGSSTIKLSGPISASNAFVVNGETFTASPTGFTVAGSELLPGGSAVVVSGTTLSLSPSGVLHIGDASVNLDSQPAPPADVIIIGGQTFTANPSGFQIDAGSAVLVPGGTPVTISRTEVSLDGSGQLHLGRTSSIRLVPFQAVSGLLIVDGLTFTPEPSSSSSAVAVNVNGVTFTPGGAAMTVGGERISLELGGASLAVGSTTVALPPRPPINVESSGVSTTVLPFEGGGQGQGRMTAKAQRVRLLLVALAGGMGFVLHL